MTSDNKTRELMSGLLIFSIVFTDTITQLMHQILSADDISRIAAHVGAYKRAANNEQDVNEHGGASKKEHVK
jgi:hypothetical protein